MEDKNKLENKAVKPETKETKKVFESIHKDKPEVPGGGFSGKK